MPIERHYYDAEHAGVMATVRIPGDNLVVVQVGETADGRAGLGVYEPAAEIGVELSFVVDGEHNLGALANAIVDWLRTKRPDHEATQFLLANLEIER